MAYEIVWTSAAWETYLGILLYLQENWGEDAAANFIKIVETKTDQLSKQPFIGRLSQKDGETRMVLLTKQNKLYFQITDNIVELLEIFDTRQNPIKNKFE